MKAHEPDAAVSDRVQDDPRVALNVQLLDASSVAARLIPNGVDEAAPESATVWAADGLVEGRQSLLVHRRNFKILTLLEVLAPQTAANNVYIVFKLSDSEVDAVIHHFAERSEGFGRYVEQ